MARPMLNEPPAVGLGLWKIANDLAAQMVRTANECGYRHLDSASDYGNEPIRGKGSRPPFAMALSAAKIFGKPASFGIRIIERKCPTGARTYDEGSAGRLSRSLLIHFPIALKICLAVDTLSGRLVPRSERRLASNGTRSRSDR